MLASTLETAAAAAKIKALSDQLERKQSAVRLLDGKLAEAALRAANGQEPYNAGTLKEERKALLREIGGIEEKLAALTV